MPLLTIEEAEPSPTRGKGPALFALGFRPFYLLAAAFAVLAVPLWIASDAGWGGRFVSMCSGTCTKWCSASRWRS